MKFQDKVVLITGGGSGIGKAVAMAFSRRSATVVVCGRHERPLQDVVSQISEMKGIAAYFKCDVRDLNSVETLVREVVGRFGKIDVLFNNAGVFIPGGVVDTDVGGIQNLIDTNLKGQFLVFRAVAKQMIAQGGGAIVNMASSSAIAKGQSAVLYTATKGAIVSMTRAGACDLAKYNIRVNSICPGTVATRVLKEWEHHDPESANAQKATIPMQRFAEPEEIAGPVMFLASDDASYITGAFFVVDGGWSAN